MRSLCLYLLVFMLCLSTADASETEDDSCDNEPPPKKLKTACYFSTSRTSPLEVRKREDRFTFSENCEGDVVELTEFSDDYSGQLYGAPHAMALMLARTEGTFLHAASDLTEWKGKGICSKHLNEIFRRYFIDQQSKKSENGQRCSACLYPEAHSSQGAKGTRVMSFQMSRNVLETKNVLVPVGAPLCQRHYRDIPKKPLDILIPSNPPAITPSPIILPAVIAPPPIRLPPMDQPDPIRLPPMDDQAQIQLPPYTPGSEVIIPPLGESSNSHTSHFSNDHHGDLPSSQNSQASSEDSEDGDYCIPTRGKQYTPVETAVHSLYKAADIDRGRCTKPFSKYPERYQREKSRVVLDILRIIIGVMTTTPEENELLMSMVTAMLAGKTPKDENAILHSLLTTTAENFSRLRKYNEKVELLSFFAHSIMYRTMSNYIPNLSERMWTEAKKRAMSPVKNPPNLNLRERYDPIKLDYLISFLTSPLIMVSMPYGEQKTKDSLGNTVILPNSIRLTGTFETIELYEKWMDETGRSHLKLSNSTTYKIISKLPALRSSAQTCVDYYMASATMAFIKIHKILESLRDMNLLDTTEAATLKRLFDEIQTYFRTDYKLHVKSESKISDHCIHHALSDPEEPKFACDPKTPHDHDRKCPMCEQLDFVFSDLKKRIETMVEESDSTNSLELLNHQHEFNESMEKILDLKSHLVRTVFTSTERELFIRELKEGEGFITMDFAQRWLPSFFRETQKDFFGKAGYSWHLSHVYAKVSDELNGSVVVEVIKHLAEDLAVMGINKLHLRSDNAGYYHSAPVMATIPSIEKDYNVDIIWSFSESQSGKSSADRYASYAKTKMRNYLSKQNNIDTHEAMFLALTQGKLLRGVSVHLATVDFTPQPKTKIDGISKLGHFEFNGDIISAWRFRGIGEGIRVKAKEGIKSSITFHSHGGKLSKPGLKDEDAQKIAKGEEPHFWFFPPKKVSTVDEPGDADDESVSGQAPVSNPDPSSSSPLFVCNQCSSSFIRYASLLRHLEKGAHKIRPEKVSQIDFALGLFKRMLEEVQQGIGITPLSDSFKDYQEASEHPKPMGWALRSTKKGARYNPKAKQMVFDLFEEFFTDSKPLRAEEAERRMRLRIDILPSERMSHDQIKNYIRTLVADKKKSTKSRRRRALLADMELDLEEDEAWIEEEVEVHEDERVIDSQAIYDLIQGNLKDLFLEPETPDFSSDPDDGNIDQ